ncbi:MAG: hypothetical protein M3T49_06630 [Candidatus Eremiobacteraeota bacterium]|nr:hypothetical protein [Candidatus Eremiobacteraeota bacterium]
MAEREQRGPIGDPAPQPKPEDTQDPPAEGEFPTFDDMPTEDPTELPDQPGT